MDARSRLLKLMEKHGGKNNPPLISLAVVVNVPPNLIIQTGDVQITKENILISDILLNNYYRQVSINSNSVISGQINFVDTLSIGDQLAVQEIEDGQTYIILCRVVSVDG
jgi:hypothetical protein